MDLIIWLSFPYTKGKTQANDVSSGTDRLNPPELWVTCTCGLRCTMAWPDFLFPSPTVASWTWLLVWKNGLPSPERAYVFNGDFVDRGKDSVEILMVLFAFMLVYPKEFHLNRGNHEDHIVNLRYKPKHAWGFGLYWLRLWSYFSRASYLLDALLKQSSNL